MFKILLKTFLKNLISGQHLVVITTAIFTMWCLKDKTSELGFLLSDAIKSCGDSVRPDT